MIAITLLWTISQLRPIFFVLYSKYISELDDELFYIWENLEYLTEAYSASQDKMLSCHNKYQFHYNSFDKKNHLLKFLFSSKIILTKHGQPTILVGALHWTLGSRLLSSHKSPLYIINTKICWQMFLQSIFIYIQPSSVTQLYFLSDSSNYKLSQWKNVFWRNQLYVTLEGNFLYSICHNSQICSRKQEFCAAQSVRESKKLVFTTYHISFIYRNKSSFL